MIKVITIDLGGVYFQNGTKIALKRIYKIVNAPKEKVDEIFKGIRQKEGWLYRRGKITKEDFWRAAVRKLKINKALVPKIQEIWHSSYKPTQGMKELITKLRKNYRLIAFSGNIRVGIRFSGLCLPPQAAGRSGIGVLLKMSSNFFQQSPPSKSFPQGRLFYSGLLWYNKLICKPSI